MKVLGIVVPPEIIEKFKKESRFLKGHKPFNKGKKMPPEVYKKVKKSFFKKGSLPPNTKFNGAVSVRKDKSGHSYQYIRIRKAKWVPLHRHMWEQKRGKIKRGYNIVFKDGNSMNCKISNLKAVTRPQLMKMNTYHNYPKPLARLIQLRGALNRQINKRLKQVS